LFAPVGDDDNTFVLKGTTPLSHIVVAVLGVGAEGELPNTDLSGIVKIDVKTQESFGSNNAVVPEFPLGSLMVMAIVVGLGILFVRINPRISNIKL
jgi:hypothetical protein